MARRSPKQRLFRLPANIPPVAAAAGLGLGVVGLLLLTRRRAPAATPAFPPPPPPPPPAMLPPTGSAPGATVMRCRGVARCRLFDRPAPTQVDIDQSRYVDLEPRSRVTVLEPSRPDGWVRVAAQVVDDTLVGYLPLTALEPLPSSLRSRSLDFGLWSLAREERERDERTGLLLDPGIPVATRVVVNPLPAEPRLGDALGGGKVFVPPPAPDGAVLGSIFGRPTKRVELPPEPPAPPSLEIARLTGEGPRPDGALAETRRLLAAFDDYYQRSWAPRVLGAAFPTIARTLDGVSWFRSFAAQAAIVASELVGRGVTSASSDEAIRAALLGVLSTRAIPGFSRHHWGTDVDVVTADSAAWRPGGRLAALVPLTRDEAPAFGLYTPYVDGRFPAPERPHYNAEPWHMSAAALGEYTRQRWLSALASGPELERLLDRAAYAIADAFRRQSAGALNLASLRRVLATLDLPSYVRNVARA